jgi:uncharacterized protein GlcG (DUF336 family)
VTLSLAQAKMMIEAAFAEGARQAMKPLAALVAAANGDVVAFERQDGSECLRFEMAFGKAASALTTGQNSRYLAEKALSGSSVVTLVNMRTGGRAMAFPGAILVKSESGTILGVVAVTGDTAEKDEVCAIAGIKAAGLIPGAE